MNSPHNSNIVIHDAVYSPQIIDEYRGNKLIEALPSILSDEELVREFPIPVKYKDEERGFDPLYRKYFLTRLLRFFKPLPQHIDLYHRFSMVLRDGYLDRNPNLHRGRELQQTYEKVQQGLGGVYIDEPAKVVNGFSITGWSGVGKSTAISNVLKFFPKAIFHSELNLYQIPWLKVDCPKDGSIKQFCNFFFRAVDNVLGTDYRRTKWKPRDTENNMMAEMAEVAVIHCLGVLIIDEFQNLSVAKAGGQEQFLNFIVVLINELKLPVIIVGTNLALPILTKELRSSRRSLGLGSFTWEPLRADEGTWDLFIEELWGYRWLQEDQRLTKAIKEAFFYETQGIIDLLVKLYIFCQMTAIDEGAESISPELIHYVADKEFSLVKGVIKAIREKDQKALFQYRDIGFDKLNEYFLKRIDEDATKSTAVPVTNENIHNAPESDSAIDMVVSMLTSLQVDEEVARSVVYRVVEDNPGIEVVSLSQKALNILKPTQNKKSVARKKKLPYPAGDLRAYFDQAKQENMDVYEVLKAHKVISLMR